MKKIVFVLALILSFAIPAVAQSSLNDKGDNIVGTYQGHQKDNGDFKVQVWKAANGTYSAKILWVEKDKDEKGNKYLDINNPNKSLRNTPCDKIVIFTGLKYNKEKQCWDDTKIYDPHRGLHANMNAVFEKDGRLAITGNKFGFSQTVYWKRIK